MKQFATVKAAIRDPAGGKTRYVLVGRAMRDGDQIAVVLDTLPRDQVNWTGWLNLFALDQAERNERQLSAASSPDFDDDIPF